MNEGMQIYKFDNMTIYQQYFFDMTRLNFMYDRRRLYSKKNTKWGYNIYFPFDMVKEKLKFYGLYLSAYVNSDLVSIDYDYDIGFNNTEYEIEKEIITMLKNEFGEIEVMIKIDNSYENRSIIQIIENEYKILFSIKGIYIVTLDDVEKLNFIQKYICGFLFGGKEFSISFKQTSFNVVDLKCIQTLIEHFMFVILRVPLFANYNLMIYSKQEEIINIINKRILDLRCNKFDIENIEKFDDPQNFLLI